VEVGNELEELQKCLEHWMECFLISMALSLGLLSVALAWLRHCWKVERSEFPYNLDFERKNKSLR